MGWETRNGKGKYYTRSRREAGRVVREYFGGGPVATLLAQLDASERASREAEKDERRREQETASDLIARLAELGIMADALVSNALESAGFQNHKGQWRQRRRTSWQ